MNDHKRLVAIAMKVGGAIGESMEGADNVERLVDLLVAEYEQLREEKLKLKRNLGESLVAAMNALDVLEANHLDENPRDPNCPVCELQRLREKFGR